MGSARISWSLHPSDSRVLRALVNLDVGLMGGVLFAFLLSVVHTLGIVGSALQGSVVAGFVLLFLVLLSRRFVPLLEAARADRERTDATEEWREAFRWPWIALVAVLVGGAVFALGRGGSYFFTIRGRVRIWGLWWLAFLLLLFVQAASAHGSVDPSTRTLEYARLGRSTWEIALDNLTGVRMLPLGGLAVVRLRFHPGTVSSRTPRYLVLPTDVADRVEREFERGIADDLPEPPDTQVRRQTLQGAVVLLGFAAVLALVFAVLAGRPFFGVFLGVFFWLPGFIALLVGLRS